MAKKKSKAKKKAAGRIGVRVTLALEPRAHASFVAAGGGEGKSGYLSAVLRQRERQWRRALEELRDWELGTVCRWIEALEYEWEQYDPGQSMARLQRFVSEDGAELPAQTELAAMWVLCAEWYAGNLAVQEALGVR